MPMTNYACPNCEGILHTDDLLEGKCLTGGCGEKFKAGFGPREDLPKYKND